LLGLAVTQRCCEHDLRTDPDAPIDRLADDHAIVRKFVQLRSQDPTGQEPLRSVRGPFPLFTLHADRMRGTTGFERSHAVVWLLGCATHRSGDRADSYEHFERLDQRGQLFPVEADYERLFARRSAQTVPIMLSRVVATLEQARTAAGQCQTVLLPGGVSMTLLVLYQQGRELKPIEQIWMGIDVKSLPTNWLPLILATLSPGEEVESWQYTREFPGRGPDQLELRFSYWHELQD
jgi:hypothetical protein